MLFLNVTKKIPILIDPNWIRSDSLGIYLVQIELPNIFFFNQNDIITYANEVCKPVKAFMATRVWPDLRAVLKYLQYVVAKRENDNQNELLMLLKATQSLVLVATMARDPIIGGIT